MKVLITRRVEEEVAVQFPFYVFDEEWDKVYQRLVQFSDGTVMRDLIRECGDPDSDSITVHLPEVADAATIRACAEMAANSGMTQEEAKAKFLEAVNRLRERLAEIAEE